jgi:hypothetical protein
MRGTGCALSRPLPTFRSRQSASGVPSGPRSCGSDLVFLGFRFNEFGVVEPAIVDGQAAIFGLGEHIGETVAP